MTIDNVQDVTPINQYVASASQTAFTYSFPIEADADIKVYVNAALKTLSTDYTVSGAGDDEGGTVTFVTERTAGDIVTLYRDIGIARSTDFPQNGPWSSAATNAELNRVILMLQQLERNIARSIRLSIFQELDTADLELNPIANWLSKFMFINASGVPEPAESLGSTVISQSIIGSYLFPTTTAEAAAAVTIVNPFYPTLDVRRYGAVADDSTDDLTAFNRAVSVAKQLGGGRILGAPGAKHLVSNTVVLDFGDISSDTERGIILDLNQSQLRTTGTAEIVRIGAASGSTSAFRKCGVVNGVLRGSGEGNTGNAALMIRNHSFGIFSDLRINNCGGRAIQIIANTRGNQYNEFRNIEIANNFRGVINLDCGSGAGGYVNDNNFWNIRALENNRTGGGETHVIFQGSVSGEAVNANRFFGCSIETAQTNDVLLVINKGTSNCFFGVRLDGTSTTKIVDIAAGQSGNVFYGITPDGTLEDDSDSIWQDDEGASNFPVIRLGSISTSGIGWDFKIQQPGSTKELWIAPNHANGIVRFPATTRVFFGTREGGDNGPMEIDQQNNRLTLRMQSDETSGNGPELRFDGTAASGGSLGTRGVRQVTGGLKVTSGGWYADSLGVGNSATASVAVGTLVRKIEIFDATGSSLGFLPVYSTIT